MADVEVYFVGRVSAAGLTQLPADVLLFATPDHTRMLPVWVASPHDLGGRPTDSEILATVLSSDKTADPWYAQITTNARGQMTAGLKQDSRFIDVRPSTLEALWHAGVLFDVTVCEAVVPAMLPVNPRFVAELTEALAVIRAAESDDHRDDDDVDEERSAELAQRLIVGWDGVGLQESPDVADDFADMWKGMGLSEEMGDWLAQPTEPDGDRDPE